MSWKIDIKQNSFPSIEEVWVIFIPLEKIEEEYSKSEKAKNNDPRAVCLQDITYVALYNALTCIRQQTHNFSMALRGCIRETCVAAIALDTWISTFPKNMKWCEKQPDSRVLKNKINLPADIWSSEKILTAWKSPVQKDT